MEKTIEKKLEGADEVIVVLSSNAIASKWVQHEGSIAYGLKKKMYPVLIEELPPEDLPLWAEDFQYHRFFDTDYESAFNELNSVLTPPNYIQGLLDQRVDSYGRTKELLGESTLQVIEEAWDTLRIDEAAEELVEKSRQAVEADKKKEHEQKQKLERTRQQRTVALTIGLFIALILSGISFSLYQQSNSNLETANTANTQVVAERNAAEVARSEAETAKSEAEEQARQAQSGKLATIALNKLESDFNLALLLSVESNNKVESLNKDENFLARDSLMTVVQYNPNLKYSLDKHTDSVLSIAFSPVGEKLASGSWDGTIRLWNVETGQQIGEPLTGHTDIVNSVTFNPDGKTLASGSSFGTIHMWDVETGQQIGEEFNLYGFGVNCVAFSPDGKTLASGSDDGTIGLWDVETGQQIGEPLTGHTDLVWSVAFSPDGKTLASGSDDDTIRLWNVDIRSWIDLACDRASRNLTESEWKIYFPGECYRQTCSQYPPEFEDARPICQ